MNYSICRIRILVHPFFKQKDAGPYIVPSMGSHGGETEEGQLNVLCHLGLTQESLGLEFMPDMDTVPIGHLSNGLPLYFSKAAFKADGIFSVNKIKPHADFKSRPESGLVKMLVTELGKHKDCAGLMLGWKERRRLNLTGLAGLIKYTDQEEIKDGLYKKCDV